MQRNVKNDFKKSYKKIGWFLLIVFPLLCIIGFLLYYFVPSLADMQYIVIMIMIAVGGIAYLVMEFILRKREEKSKNKPKKFDPFAD